MATRALSDKAQVIYSKVSPEETKFGELKKIAKELKSNHEIAMELWSTKEFRPRMLATLIVDKKLLTQDLIDQLAGDMADHEPDEANRLSEWLMANQLMKSKKTTALLEKWEHHPTATLRRLFWYHQARLRWTGQTPPGNSAELVASLEKNLENEEPQVQWAMNFCAGQIGIREPQYRARCISLGERLGLYKGEAVSKGCTPSYLPEFIKIEVAKLSK